MFLFYKILILKLYVYCSENEVTTVFFSSNLKKKYKPILK